MMLLPDCPRSHETAVARIVRDESVSIAAGKVVDRSGSDALEDVECGACGRVLRPAADLTAEEVDFIIDGLEVCP